MGDAGGWLSTHVLDTASGLPAEGVAIQLYRLDGASRELVAEAVTNADGRTDEPILPREAFAIATYELVFMVGDYLKSLGSELPSPMFLDQVPIRFGMAEHAHYHVPLLLSPYGYSTYRGS